MFHSDTFDPKPINDMRVRLLLPVALGSAALFVVAKPMIQLLYTEPYWGAAPNLAIIALGCWVGTICHTYGNVLLGAGKPKYITFATALKTITFMALAYPCFQKWGVPGIAVAVSISEFGSLAPMLMGARTIGVAIPGKELLLTLIGGAYGCGLYGLQWATIKATGSVTAGFVVCAALTAGVCLLCLRSLMSYLRRAS